jgi:hypothetical protein
MGELTADAETTIWARLHGKTSAFAIKTTSVPVVFDNMDGYEDFTEQSAVEEAVEVLEGRLSGEGATMYAVHCLLWAACRCPAGKAAEKAARGGKSIGFDIAYEPDGSLLYGLHVLDGSVPDVRRLSDVRDAARVPKGAPIN